jgi:hypothetical protein
MEDEELEVGEDGFEINDDGEIDPLDTLADEEAPEDPEDRFH